MDRFYPHDEPLPLLLCLVMGLQHAFAMVGGLITPPFVVFKFTIDFMNVELQQYAIVASLIASGACARYMSSGSVEHSLSYSTYIRNLHYHQRGPRAHPLH